MLSKACKAFFELPSYEIQIEKIMMTCVTACDVYKHSRFNLSVWNLNTAKTRVTQVLLFYVLSPHTNKLTAAMLSAAT